MREVAPTCGSLLMDTWGWELLSGADGPDSVVKGLVRVKQRDQITAVGSQWKIGSECLNFY